MGGIAVAVDFWSGDLKHLVGDRTATLCQIRSSPYLGKQSADHLTKDCRLILRPSGYDLELDQGRQNGLS